MVLITLQHDIPHSVDLLVDRLIRNLLRDTQRCVQVGEVAATLINGYPSAWVHL